jgi:hypothetical protein
MKDRLPITPIGWFLLLHGLVAHFNKEITMNEEMTVSYVIFGVVAYALPILVIGALVCTLLSKVVAFVM